MWDESSEVILGEKSGVLCVYLCVGVGVGGCGSRDAGASAARLKSKVWDDGA